jgi:3-oxoacyl-[acyl-carrier-protein] synthase III
MATASVRNVRLAGVSACVPKTVARNEDFDLLSPEERAKVIKTTGIESRRIAPVDQCTSDLCAVAATALLDNLNWNRDEVDALVLVTQTADYTVPATAPILQDRLGLPKSCLAFDVNLGCSGYTYGLQVVASLLAAGGLRKGLLLVGDTPSKTVSPRDRSAAPLFGDAGAATALEFVPGEVMHFDFGSDGSGYEAIIIPDGGLRNPVGPASLEVVDVQEGVSRNRCQLILDGVEIFNFSLREVPKTVRGALAAADQNADDVDAFVFHQANLIMNDLIRKKLKLPEEKVPYSLRDFGNTSSASIPLTIVTELRPRITEERMRLVLCGFGVGLSWSTVYLETDRIACPPVIEV